MAEWIVERWDAEVAHRPIENIHRRTLDATWRQVYRWLTDEELPRMVHRAGDPPLVAEVPDVSGAASRGPSGASPEVQASNHD